MGSSGLLVLAGLAALAAGADVLVRGASRLSLSLGLSPLVVGLTVVAFGTSAPEVAVSVGAVLDGQGDIAMGNVVGSNIFNVLLILGISAVILPLAVDRQIIRQEVPIMLGASVLLLVLSLDGKLVRAEAALLFALMLAYTAFVVVQARRQQGSPPASASPGVAGGAPDTAGAAGAAVVPTDAGPRWIDRWPAQVGLVVAGLGLLVVGSHWLVDGAVAIARAWGLSEVVIGLTIVAAGTSMPEVAASVAAAWRGERDIAVGNVVGSNIFNILGCLGLSGLVAGPGGLEVAPSILRFDIWVMLAAALACLPVFVSGREIARWEGGVFLAYLVAYMAYVVLAQQNHDALPAFSATMVGFALPLTVVTLVVMMLPRAARA
jgi:cation:H+ antiporter